MYLFLEQSGEDFIYENKTTRVSLEGILYDYR